jgi:hypothetical protein
MMETNRSIIQLNIPEVDTAFIKQLAKRIGCIIEKKTAVDKALEDVKAGRVHRAKSVDDMFKQILG